VLGLARPARGQPYSRLASRLEYSEGADGEGEEYEEAGALWRVAEHEGGCQQDPDQQGDATDEITAVLPARSDVARGWHDACQRYITLGQNFQSASVGC
jgi:hypothetical protein